MFEMFFKNKKSQEEMKIKEIEVEFKHPVCTNCIHFEVL